MQTDTLTDEILATLKARDLLAKRDVIESALTDPATGQQTEEWISKHLNPSTLLSREELVLYVSLLDYLIASFQRSRIPTNTICPDITS
jgi:hypothetical protein